MIAARFRLVGWVAGCAGAALCCYMASQWVAAERSALAKVDGDIARTQGDIARLETEVTARSRAGQVEKWNYTLALQAAKPGQYVQSGVELASMAGGRKLPLDPAIVASHGAVQTVAYQPVAPLVAPVAAPATVALMGAPKPTLVPHLAADHPGLLHQATFVQPKPSRLADDDAPAPGLHLASLERPAPAKAKRQAEKAKPKLDEALLPDDLGTLIAAERRAKPAKRAL